MSLTITRPLGGEGVVVVVPVVAPVVVVPVVVVAVVVVPVEVVPVVPELVTVTVWVGSV
jgi:hypothetical protein